MHATLCRLGAPLLAALLAGCSPGAEPGPPRPAHAAPALAEPEEPLLVMADLMALVIDPAAGVLDPETHRDPLRRPRSAEAWQAVADAATALERAADVLQEPGWSFGRTDWLRAVAELREGSRASGAAARSHDLPRLAEAGERLRGACAGCHARYAPDQR